jgi:hypothetical protein
VAAALAAVGLHSSGHWSLRLSAQEPGSSSQNLRAFQAAVDVEGTPRPAAEQPGQLHANRPASSAFIWAQMSSTASPPWRRGSGRVVRRPRGSLSLTVCKVKRY